MTAPAFGDRRKAMLEDIAVLTGGRVHQRRPRRQDRNVTLEISARPKNRIDKDNTTIISGGGKKSEIQSRCAQLRAQIEETTSDYDKEKLQERLAKLAGGVAIIRVGGSSTEVEVQERKDRVDDAMHPARAAVEGGLVAGGGVTLLYASKVLGALRPANDEQRVGIDIVRRALQARARQIFENAGEDGAVIAGKLLEKNDPHYGFDAQKGAYANDESGHHRPDQGRAPGLAGSGLCCRPPGHYGSDGRRQSRRRDVVDARRHGRCPLAGSTSLNKKSPRSGAFASYVGA